MKMNKYQEALLNIRNAMFAPEYVHESIMLLNELAKKETPLIPIELSNEVDGIADTTESCCPKCKAVVDHEYCGNCGQKIDW